MPFDQFLTSDSVRNLDAIVVALPHHLHQAAICCALDAGLEVFCEKPLCLDGASIDRIAERLELTQRKLAVCQPRRRFPATIAIRHLIETGWLGNCRSAAWSEGTPYGWPAESLAQVLRETGGEMLFDIGAHVFDCLTWWFGDLSVQDCRDDSLGGAATSFAIELSATTCPKIDVRLSRIWKLANRVTLEFERGTVVYQPGQDAKLEIQSDTLPIPNVELSSGGVKTDFVDAVRDELLNFANLVHGHPSRSVTIVEARRTVRVFDQCDERRGGQCANKEGVKRGPESFVLSTGTADSRQMTPAPFLRSKRIAVTGAGGFIGTRIVEIALERGYDVTAVTHRPMSSIRPARTCAQLKLADVLDVASLRRAFEGCDAIVHGAYSTQDTEQIRRTVIDGSHNVLRVARECGVQSVVMLGSMLSYGDPPRNGTVAEDASTVPRDVYGIAKRSMALNAIAFGQKTEMRVAVLEPTCVFGPFGRDFGSTYITQMRQGRFYVVEEGRGAANLIFVDNVVDAVLRAVESTDLPSGRYILNEEEHPTTWHDYFLPMWRLLSPEPLPAVTRQMLAAARRRRSIEGRPWNVARAAVRNYGPARELVAQNSAFRLWKRLTTGKESVVPSTAHRRQVGRVGSRQTTPAPFSGAIALDGYIPDETFVNLFDSQAVYSSAKFRELTAWTPAIDRPTALQANLTWATNYLRSERPEFDPVATEVSALVRPLATSH